MFGEKRSIFSRPIFARLINRGFSSKKCLKSEKVTFSPFWAPRVCGARVVSVAVYVSLSSRELLNRRIVNLPVQ